MKDLLGVATVMAGVAGVLTAVSGSYALYKEHRAKSGALMRGSANPVESGSSASVEVRIPGQKSTTIQISLEEANRLLHR